MTGEKGGFMGYRSQVAIALKKETYYKHENVLRDYLKDCDDVPENELGFYFYWDSVKWYDSYEDVKAVQNIMKESGWEEYAFIRIGEEADDVEQEGDTGSFELYVCRSIDIPSSKTVEKKDFFATNSIKFIKED